MKKLLVLFIVLLLIGCSKGAEVKSKLDSPAVSDSTKGQAVQQEEEPVQKEDILEPVQEETDSASEEVPEENTKPTPAKDTATKDTCVTDSRGVIRMFHADGTKTVYRDDCIGGVLSEYECVLNEIRTYNTICPYGCKQGPYGDSCAFP